MIVFIYESELVLIKISVVVYKGDIESGGFYLCWKILRV